MPLDRPEAGHETAREGKVEAGEDECEPGAIGAGQAEVVALLAAERTDEEPDRRHDDEDERDRGEGTAEIAHARGPQSQHAHERYDARADAGHDRERRTEGRRAVEPVDRGEDRDEPEPSHEEADDGREQHRRNRRTASHDDHPRSLRSAGTL